MAKNLTRYILIALVLDILWFSRPGARMSVTLQPMARLGLLVVPLLYFLADYMENAAIEQKDPLLIYKLESFNLFKAMIERINGDVVGFLAKAGLPSAQPQVQQAQAPRAPQQRLQTSRTETPQFAGAARTSAAPRPAPSTGAPMRAASRPAAMFPKLPLGTTIVSEPAPAQRSSAARP